MEKYKFTIIYSGNEPIKKADGEIEFLGLKKDYEYHSNAMYDYIKENYSDIKAFENVTPTLHVQNAAYVLTLFGSIVFINTTPLNEKSFNQYGSSGMLFLPKNLTDSQRDHLLEFQKTLTEYNLEIQYDLNYDNGMVDGKMLRKEKNYSGDALTNFISNYGIENKKQL